MEREEMIRLTTVLLFTLFVATNTVGQVPPHCQQVHQTTITIDKEGKGMVSNDYRLLLGDIVHITLPKEIIGCHFKYNKSTTVFLFLKTTKSYEEPISSTLKQHHRAEITINTIDENGAAIKIDDADAYIVVKHLRQNLLTYIFQDQVLKGKKIIYTQRQADAAKKLLDECKKIYNPNGDCKLVPLCDLPDELAKHKITVTIYRSTSIIL